MLVSIEKFCIDWARCDDGRYRPFRLRIEVDGVEAYCLETPEWLVDAICVHKTTPPPFSPFSGRGVWVSIDPDSLGEEGARFVVLGGRLYDLKSR